MTLREEIKKHLALEDITLTDVVARMNSNRDTVTTVQNINNKLARGTIKFIEVQEIAIP